MRKFIALGLGVVTSATLAFGAVSPASAEVVPPGALENQMCAALPAALQSTVNAVNAAVLAQSTAATDMTAKHAAFTSAQADLIAALVDYIVTVDSGGSVAAKAQILADRLSVYSQKAAAWVNAWMAKDTADRNAALATINNGFFTGLDGALGCTVS